MELQFTDSISAQTYNDRRNPVNGKPLSDRQVENVLKNTPYFVVALSDGKTIGLARVLTDYGNIYFIADVIVLPQYHGQGLGRLLMERVLDSIKSTVEPGETVQIHLMSVKDREGFYEKFGFRRRPDEEFGHGMTQWYSSPAPNAK